MNDDTPKPEQSSDEEYQFAPEGEETSAFAPTEQPQKTSIFEHLKRRNIFIAVGVIIAAFVIYKMTDVFFSNSGPRVRTAAARPAAAVTTPAPAPIQQEAATTPAPAPVSASAPALSEDRIGALEDQNKDLQSKLDQLAAQLADVQTTLSGVGSQVSSLNDTVQSVAGQVAKQQAQAAAIAAQKKQAAEKARVAPKPVYYVRALVPGRAWLATENGGTLTVGQGDNLPGYGIVQSIDATQGIITTSTGAIIGHRPDDI